MADSFPLSPLSENEEDTLNNQVDQDSSTILNECKRDTSKRRPSLAQKMTSNLRRLSGATELKIDINDSITPNNPKYCNKKIKVSRLNRMKIFGKLKPPKFGMNARSLGNLLRQKISRINDCIRQTHPLLSRRKKSLV